MPSLKEKIFADLGGAIRSKDELRTSVLRLLKSAIEKWEMAGMAKRAATDDDVIGIVQKEAKQRKEAAELYRKGGREDLAAKEDRESAILVDYLPQQLSEEALRALVQQAIATTGASSKADMGKVMGALMPAVKGKADGAMVSRVVGSLLK